ncbi:MAG: hypothetical protein ABI443_11280 [Chthoniobacterales bacterium]
MKKSYLLSIGILVFIAGSALQSQSTKPVAPAPTATVAPTASPDAAAESNIDPRSKALELAGAFTNDGFKIRDGYFTGTIDAKKPQIFALNLSAGNQYWFCVGAVPADQKLTVSVYDENGKKVDSEKYQDLSMAAAGIVAENSGRYFVYVALEDAPKAEAQKAEYSFLYTYK